jgi:hypothetical protein
MKTVILSDQLVDGSCSLWMVDTFDNEQRLALGKASEAPLHSESVFAFPNFVAVRFFESEDILDALKRDKSFPASFEQQVRIDLW